MKQVTLCLCLKNDEVLLAMKKRGFGAGKWNGYGGKIQDGESPSEAAVRELEEESGLIASTRDLEQVAVVHFYFAGVLSFECFVFLLRQWQGEPVETEEMCPQWYQADALPYFDMWVADTKWIPKVLAGETITAEVYFNADGSEVEKVLITPATF